MSVGGKSYREDKMRKIHICREREVAIECVSRL